MNPDPACPLSDGVRFWAISIPWTSSERDGDDAGDVTPILHALFRMAFQGRGIVGQPLSRLLRPADPGRPIPARAEASADRAGGCPVVQADGRRILGLQGLRRRRGVLRLINKTCWKNSWAGGQHLG